MCLGVPGRVISVNGDVADVDMEPFGPFAFKENVAVAIAVAAELGISRQTFYKYKRRWDAEGPAGLVERSRSSLPPLSMLTDRAK